MQAESGKFVILELGGTSYAVPSGQVQRLELVENITPVPNAVTAVEGVVFSGGKVIPAVNLRVRFGLPKIPYDLRSRLVVIQCAGRSIGLIADAAREFTTIPSQAIGPPPEGITNLSGSYIEGIARLGERIVIVLKLEEVIQISDPTADAIRQPAISGDLS